VKGTKQSRDRSLGSCSYAKALLWMTALACASGCGSGMCVDGLDLGTTYQVSVLEVVSETSQYAAQTSHGPDFGAQIFGGTQCAVGFDFVAGSEFLIEPVSKLNLNHCYGRLAVPRNVDEIALLEESNSWSHGGGQLMRTPVYSADRSGCSGWWQLVFISTGASPLKAPIPGEHPPVLLLRYFRFGTTDGTICGQPSSTIPMYSECKDYFVVQLTKT
jgi:hypothetical protein